MGVVATIDHKSFPRQSDLLGKRVRVCFRYDTDHELGGECVRDDLETPWMTILRLDDGRHVLAGECQLQYSW